MCFAEKNLLEKWTENSRWPSKSWLNLWKALLKQVGVNCWRSIFDWRKYQYEKENRWIDWRKFEVTWTKLKVEWWNYQQKSLRLWFFLVKWRTWQKD